MWYWIKRGEREEGVLLSQREKGNEQIKDSLLL